MLNSDSAEKFNSSRAGEYEKQSRIALAGYEACHELSACILSAALGPGSTANILVVGAGGGAQEIITAGSLEPNWQFTAVDPSQPMMDLAVVRLRESNLRNRTTLHVGYVNELPLERRFDAATLIGVLHHIPGDEAKRSILKSISERLPEGAPLILACNYYTYTSQPLFLSAWANRWRMQGAAPEEITEKLDRILQGADPPDSESVVISLLTDAGFQSVARFFSSLFWGAWIAYRAP